MKKFLAVLIVASLALSLAACGGGGGEDGGGQQAGSPGSGESAPPTSGTTDAPQPDPAKEYSLTVAMLDGSWHSFPIWIAEEKGWFADAGLTIDTLIFTNGPVQMEAIDSWDVGTTGIGGILSGTLNYGAVVLALVGTDDGTVYVWARPDSPVVRAGQGKHPTHPEIYGDSESWKGMEVNSTFGTVLHLALLKTLEGFGLTIDDIQVNWMDMPTANAAFLAGEGDGTTTSGANSYMEDKDNFVAVSTAQMAEVGLINALMANPDTLKSEESREAILLFMEIFFRAVEWIEANHVEALDYLIEWNAFVGRDIDHQMADSYLSADTYFGLSGNAHAWNTKAASGDYTVAHEYVLNILRFFIEVGNYQEGDDVLFLKPEHFDLSFIQALTS